MTKREISFFLPIKTKIRDKVFLRYNSLKTFLILIHIHSHPQNFLTFLIFTFITMTFKTMDTTLPFLHFFNNKKIIMDQIFHQVHSFNTRTILKKETLNKEESLIDYFFRRHFKNLQQTFRKILIFLFILYLAKKYLNQFYFKKCFYKR